MTFDRHKAGGSTYRSLCTASGNVVKVNPLCLECFHPYSNKLLGWTQPSTLHPKANTLEVSRHCTRRVLGATSGARPASLRVLINLLDWPCPVGNRWKQNGTVINPNREAEKYSQR